MSSNLFSLWVLLILTGCINIDLKSIDGHYMGQSRRGMMRLEVATLENAIVIGRNGRNSDTLTTYIGDSTWYDGIRTYQLKDNELRYDEVSGHYVLKKQ